MPGYTKFCWFLCEWYNMDRKHHYNQKQWPKWESLNPRQKNVVHTPLINPKKVHLPPLHIQLGLIKNVIKAMDQNSVGFMYLKNKFPRINDAKIKEGIFVWPQIRALIQDIKFEDQLHEVEKPPWKSSKNLLPIFWEIIQQTTITIWQLVLYSPTKLWGVMHFLDSHLEFFTENLRALKNEYGQWFHNISTIEKWHQSKLSPSMLNYYCWTLGRDIPHAKYSRKSTTVTF